MKIRWNRVLGGAAATLVILIGLGWADWMNHYLLAAGLNAAVGGIYEVAVITDAAKRASEHAASARRPNDGD